MNLLSRHADYAVQALCFMYSRNAPITALALCNALHLPYPFMRSLLQKLSGADLVASSRGKGGGFSTTVKAHEIPIAAVVQLFQGSPRVTECLFRKQPCSRRSICRLRSFLLGIEASVVENSKRQR